MEVNRNYTVSTLHLINGDTINAIQSKQCPLGEQIVYQFEHPKSNFITIRYDDIGTVSVPIKNILYISSHHMTIDELNEYLDIEATEHGD